MEDDLLLVWGDAPMEREEGEDEDEEKRVLGWGRRNEDGDDRDGGRVCSSERGGGCKHHPARWRRTACPVRVQRRERGEEMRGGGIQNGVSSHFSEMCVCGVFSKNELKREQKK